MDRDLAVRETLYAQRSATGAGGASETEVRAPMNGKVVAVLAGEGVEKGQLLVVVEAMKMQHEMTTFLRRGRRAILCQFRCRYATLEPSFMTLTRSSRLRPAG